MGIEKIRDYIVSYVSQTEDEDILELILRLLLTQRR